MDKSLKFLTKQVADRLSSITPSPLLEAELILGEVLGMDRSKLLAESNIEVNPTDLDRIEEIVIMRLKRKPLQQLLGRQDFMGSGFKVNDQVLIPRSDTEMLVNYTIDHIEQKAAKLDSTGAEVLQVLDLGTGSGAIAISILTQLANQPQPAQLHREASAVSPKIEVWASDISPAALSLAEVNAKSLLPSDLLNQLHFVESDVWNGLKGNRFDIIITNPPYLPSGLKKDWQPELNFEPEQALISGVDGFDMYRKIFSELKSMAKQDAVFLGEFHSPLAAEILELAGKYGFKQAKLLPDLSGVNRYLQISL